MFRFHRFRISGLLMSRYGTIGVNGTPASADYAEEMHKVIKECLQEIFGDASKDIPVLYGGSVNPGNANELIVQPSIDGLFTGRGCMAGRQV